MGHASAPPCVRDLFTACDELPPRARLQLAGLVDQPGRPLPLFAGQIDHHLLPRDVVGFVETLTLGLGPVIANLHTGTLGQLVPAIAAHPGGLATHSNAIRLHNAANRYGGSTWAALSSLTFGEINDWANVGPGSVHLLVGCALHDAAQLVADGQPLPRTPTELALLLVYDTSGVLRETLAQLAAEPHPPEIRSAASKLLGNSPEAAELRLVDRALLASLDRVFAAVGDRRGLTSFEHQTLAFKRATYPQMALALSLSMNRVSQLRNRAELTINSALDAAPRHVFEVTLQLNERLGRAAPTTAVDAALADLGLPPSHDTRSQLLLWRAGPYRPLKDDPAWLATDGIDLVTATTEYVRDDGGVRPLEQLRKELLDLGLLEDHIGAWLMARQTLVVDDLVIATTGSIADVAARLLDAGGKALSIDELAQLQGASRRALTSALANDRRFVEVAQSTFELLDWHPGLPAAGQPVEPVELAVVVDAEVLKGASAAIPDALALALGVRPGGRRIFSSRFGPLTISDECGHTQRGSLRLIALASGAVLGAVLHLCFDPASESITVTVDEP